MTILYRTHAQSRTFEEEFIRRGTPYRIVSGVRFYERKEIKDLLAYLRVIANADDELQPPADHQRSQTGHRRHDRRAASSNFADQEGIVLFEAMRRVDEVEDVSPAYAKRVKEFTELIWGFRAPPKGCPSQASWTSSSMRRATSPSSGRKDASRPRLGVENLKEFLSVTKEFETQVESSLDAFLDHVALVSDVDAYDEDVDMVTMMTLHSAKGLEFPVVFLVGMEDGVFPHSRALWEPGELEEERRLCYVGMTRAMQVLYLTCAKYRTLYGQTNYNNVSRFIDEVPRSLIQDLGEERARARFGVSASARSGGARPWETGPGRTEAGRTGPGKAANGHTFTSGQRVRHAKFGIGTVVSVQPSASDTIVTVAFPGEGVKKLMLSMAPVEPV